MIEASVIPDPVFTLNPAALAEAQYANLLREQAEREMESLRLYEPLPAQAPFHASKVKKRIVRGSNRGGKTTPGMVEIARAVTGQDPYDKYPKENGRCIMVAMNEMQIGSVFFRKLFEPGAFKVIKDLATGKWRAYRPDVEPEREHEAKDCQPLIPERFIEDIAWKDKKQGIPAKVMFKNGWEITFFSGDGRPPNGIDVDLALFDEEIGNRKWYPEISFRLLDRKGRFIWTCTPQNGTEALQKLSELAVAQSGWDTPDVVEFKISIFDNKHLPKEEVEQSVREWEDDPEQYKIRIEGEFNTAAFLVYPDFSMSIHGCDAKDDDHPDGIVIDERWNRFAIVDPGRQVCAVLFGAIPPPDHPCAEQRFIYQELYLRKANAEIFGDAMLSSTEGLSFRAFLIDPSSQRQDIIGGGPSVFHQYTSALASRQIKSNDTGHSFMLAANEQSAGIMKVKSWLHVRAGTGRPVLQIVRGRCRNLELEFKRYRNKKVNDEYTDKPIDRDDHLLDGLRYFAMHDPQWVPQPQYKTRSFIYEYFKKHQRERAKENGDSRSIDFGTKVA